MWNNVKIFCRWFRKVMKMSIAFGWFWSLLKFFLFEWRFPTVLGMLSFCWDSKFRCPILIWVSESATLVHVKYHEQLFQTHHWYLHFFERNTACCFWCCVLFCQNEDSVFSTYLICRILLCACVHGVKLKIFESDILLDTRSRNFGQKIDGLQFSL